MSEHVCGPVTGKRQIRTVTLILPPRPEIRRGLDAAWEQPRNLHTLLKHRHRHTLRNPCLWLSRHWSHLGLCGQAGASAPCPPFSWFGISSLSILSVNIGDRRKAGYWGSMGRGPLFLCIASNELRQPLMGSLTKATRWNRSPSWQSGQAGCLTLYESLIRVWARPVQLAQALCMMLIRRQSP